MIKHALTTIVALAFVSAVAAAQQTQTPPATEKKQDPAVQSAPRSAAQLANIRIELTITEQRAGTSLPRTVIMTVADREFGRVRASRSNARLNVDARPEILASGRIRVAFSFEYLGEPEQGEKPGPLLTESIGIILDDGKVQVLSQSADPGPASDSVRVEVKATISK